ncbi:MAG TPA: single-stranded DNA-binding protein [Spirochaetota bacterium]|nr:single-stranded DNA-binding protein [Spirochaetota bacterium]HPN12400.1 single-stranded DNA-binding protein [Spirochaetota bacterium]HQL82864.1 single-stranded DNA-binding protein [Spirochaetota bacterium]
MWEVTHEQSSHQRSSYQGSGVKDPALKELENNKSVCTFFIANDVLDANRKTDFYRVSAWGSQARIISEQAATGPEFFITGRLEQHRYENDKGDTVYDNSIVIEQFDFGARVIQRADKAGLPHPLLPISNSPCPPVGHVFGAGSVAWYQRVKF